MKRTCMLLFLLVAALSLAARIPQAGANKLNGVNTPMYTADGNLKFPAHYREWVYLSSGVDMSYSPNAMNMDHSMFDNVFANREAQGRDQGFDQQERTLSDRRGDGPGGAREG